jgi:RNA polymerase sigma factor (sigma-70 family)
MGTIESIDDLELLRRYAAGKSQAAFAELVRRRIGLVYSVARRQVGGDIGLAQDVTQAVFRELASKASSLLDRPALSGWLYRATQSAAVEAVRTERRRRAQEAQTVSEPGLGPHESTDWEQLRPLLDDAMSELSDEDRDALAVRFFEGRSFAEVGTQLKIPEDAARKRVQRALDKLIVALSRRGFSSTPNSLGSALSEQGASPAPAGLANAVVGTALAAAGTKPGAHAAGGTGSQTAVAAAVAVALVAVAFGVYEARQVRGHAAELVAARAEQEASRSRIDDLQRRVQSAEQRAKAAEDDNANLIAAIARARASQATVITPTGTPGTSRPQRATPADVADGPETETTSATPAAPAAAAEAQIHLRLIQLRRNDGESDAALAARANQIIARFNNGERFEDLATELSSDPRRARGGDWGWQKRSDFQGDFADALFSLNKGQVSAPIIRPEGAFILYVEDKK